MATDKDIDALPEGLKVVYVAVDQDPTRNFLYAAWDKASFRILAMADRSFASRTVETRVIDVAKLRREALARLDGIDRLVLNLPDWIEEGQTKCPGTRPPPRRP